MTKQIALGLAVCVGLSLTGCIFDDDDGGIFNCVEGQGPIVSQSFDLPSFSGVDLEIDADVYITQGGEQEVIVEGQENILDQLELTISSDTWEIDLDGCTRYDDPLKIYITLPEVTYLRIDGSGDMISENIIEGDDILLRISGSGDMDLGLNMDDKVEAKISGSGTIFLEGEAKKTDFQISGSGDYQTFNLETDKCDIKISGSGDAEVFVNDDLDVKISGSGDVLYRGNPAINADITGSGEIIDAN